MKIGVYTNLTKDRDLGLTRALVLLLQKCGAEFYLFRNLAQYFKDAKLFDTQDYSKLDLIITVGGDGTVLSVAQYCLTADIPILPLNKGTKGFLNEIELSNIERVGDVINGNYNVDTRMLIEVGLNNKRYYALNEAFISRTGAKMIALDSYVGGLKADKYFCDGLLVCTPTGSTAYSLSAGGPIISPSARAMCITPVCSHSLHSRPIVVGESETIRVEPQNNYDDAILTIDGVTVDKIGKNAVIIKKAEKSVRFLRLKEYSFYNRLLDKLNGLV